MYEIIKTVIESGRFELVEMLKKIDKMWLEGNIADEQREELITLAREKANPENSIELLKKIKEIDARVTVLEKKGENTPEETDEHPEYVPGKWYYRNDKITFKDKKYICTAPSGTVCTWNPEEYPAYWELVE